MNITQIDLLSLKHRLDKQIPLSEIEKDSIDRLIWSFSGREIDFCDIIMILGNPTCVDLRLPTALELWKKFPDAKLVPCGGVLLPGKVITEAEAMKAACLQAGVPASSIFLENRSTITRENIEFAAPILRDLGVLAPTIVAISSPTHMRRVKMNFDKFIDLFPVGAKVIPMASNVLHYTKDNWINDESMRKEVSMELGYIHEYIFELGYQAFDF